LLTLQGSNYQKSMDNRKWFIKCVQKHYPSVPIQPTVECVVFTVKLPQRKFIQKACSIKPSVQSTERVKQPLWRLECANIMAKFWSKVQLFGHHCITRVNRHRTDIARFNQWAWQGETQQQHMPHTLVSHGTSAKESPTQVKDPLLIPVDFEGED
jgi:hypothetical protein